MRDDEDEAPASEPERKPSPLPGWAIVDLGSTAPARPMPRRYIQRQWDELSEARTELGKLLVDAAPDSEWRARLTIAWFDGLNLHGDGWRTNRRIRKNRRRAA